MRDIQGFAARGCGAATLIGKPFEIADIQHELSRTGAKLAFADPLIEQLYVEERQRSARRYHWATVLLTTAMFCSFLISESKTAPEIVTLSAWLRFAVLMPAAIAYVVLDWRGRLGRWSNSLLSLLILAPTVISGIDLMFVTSAPIVSGFQPTPLLQLAVLTCRMGVVLTAVTNGLACLTYCASILTMPLMPAELLPPMLLTDLAIAAATMVCTLQIDLRDRRVYLLAQQADLGRELLAAQNRQLAKLTQIDALTGLGNRRCFDETLTALWSDERLAQTQVTLIMFDIDCFKLFNDTYGHHAGDECLATLARTVSRCLRDDRDTLVRYGGEEFAIVLPDTSLEDGCHVAERVRQFVGECAIPHPAAGPTSHVTVSLGVATVVPLSQSAVMLIEAADHCLYEAKRNGRNRVEAQRSLPPARTQSSAISMLAAHVPNPAPLP